MQNNKALDIVLCPRCGLKNTPASFQCGKCGFPLTEKAAKELYERREKADELMDVLTQHPEVIDILRKTISNHHGGPQISTQA